MFTSVEPTRAETEAARAGDELIPGPDVVMDRAFTVVAPPSTVWPWIEQLGKGRAGWYLPTRIETCLPRSRRASRSINPRWLHQQVGDVIPDYGGRHETFTVAAIDPPRALVYRSRRGRTDLTWSITLEPTDRPVHTRVLLRLRLAPVRRKWLANTAGEFFDALTIAAMAAGLRERLHASDST